MDEPQRSATLAALHEFYCPVQAEDVDAYTAIFAPQLGRISDLVEVLATEASAWRSGRLGPVWLCPALADAEAVANPAYLTRSDWSIENRLLIRGGSQARHAWLARVFADQYLVATEQGIRHLSPIVSRIRHHAISADQHLLNRVTSSLDHNTNEADEDIIEELREAAEDSYAALAAEDQPRRRQLAQQLEHLEDSRRIFGNDLIL